MSKYPFFPPKFRDELITRHTEGHRHYHGLKHLLELWTWHLENGGTEDDFIIKYAIAYHDCVYDPKRDDNEAKSNEIWLQHAATLGLPANMIQAVSNCILATARHLIRAVTTEEFPDYVQWFCDLDLIPLAAAPEAFRVNGFNIRQEYSYVPEADFAKGRRAFYVTMLEAPRLYLTDALHQKYDPAARNNLTWALWAMDRGVTV